MRRPILAIVGGTNLGKSLLAAKVLGKVAHLLQLPSFLEVTVDGDSLMDLSEFDLAKHAGVNLDCLGDVMMHKQHWETLHGVTNEMVWWKVCDHDVLQCTRCVPSCCHCYHGPQCRELAHAHHGPLTRRHQNTMVIRLSETAWETADVAVASTLPMAEWSIGVVANWLEGLNMGWTCTHAACTWPQWC